jgi:hypothetical protein
MSRRGPENPLSRLARMLGGAVLMRGHFGHRVLGQLIVADVTQAEYAGATLVLSAGARRRGVLTQAALGTAAPAIAVHGVAARRAKQLARQEQQLAQRERALHDAVHHDVASRAVYAAMRTATPTIAEILCGLDAELATARGDLEAARDEIERLRKDNERLGRHLADLTPVAPAAAEPEPEPQLALEPAPKPEPTPKKPPRGKRSKLGKRGDRGKGR